MRSPTLARAVVEPVEPRALFSVPSPGFVTDTVLADASLANPTSMAFAPDGRLFVTLQGGSLRVLHNVTRAASNAGPVTNTEFLHLNVVRTAAEGGLLCVALDPDFAATRHLYVYYSVPASGTAPAHNRVSRFTASADNPDVVEPGSETVLLDIDPAVSNHNGGALHFGPDGKLYAAVGEHTQTPHAQTLTSLHGKILRINRDGSIPEDNPFYDNTTGVYRAIWALGLRNPYTFAIQPGTGRMFINDVGEASFEEVDEGRAGSNYGWGWLGEGPFSGEDYALPAGGPPAPPQFIPRRDPVSPTFFYPRGVVAGAEFYNPPAGTSRNFPDEYVGQYFFGDFNTGAVRRLDPDANAGLHLGRLNSIRVNITYDGSVLSVTMRDQVTGGTVTRSYPVDVPALVGDAALVGFAGSASGLQQDVRSWTLTPAGGDLPTINYSGGFESVEGLTLEGSAAPARQGAAFALRLTHAPLGGAGTAQSGAAYFTTPVSTHGFSTEFVWKQGSPTSRRAAAADLAFTLRPTSAAGADGPPLTVRLSAPGYTGASAGTMAVEMPGASPARTELAPTDARVTHFGVAPMAVDLDLGPDGTLYYLGYSDNQFTGGRLGRFRYVPGPRVEQVYVERSGWTPEFRQLLFGEAGSGELGHAVPAGVARTPSVPWDGIDRLRLRFDRDVDVQTLRQPGALTVRGVDVPQYQVTFLDYDPVTEIATWAVDAPAGRGAGIASDRLRLVLSDAVTDDLGDRLNGEWTPGRAYPSGDDAEGGAFDFRFDVLGGDANRDGRVNALDLAAVRQRLGTAWDNSSNPPRDYTIFHDGDGDGRITNTDLWAVRTAVARAARRRVAGGILQGL